MWPNWMAAVLKLRPAFKRLRTFQWFVIILAAMSVRVDMAGVTSFIRSLNIYDGFYTNLLHFFHSSAVDLSALTQLWTSLALELFPNKFMINGRIVLVGDGIKIGKEGLKMPAVKLLHQSSQNNSKAEYIMGHSFQAISLLVCSSLSVIGVPLTCRIHEGIKTGPMDRKTLMDKFLALVDDLNIQTGGRIYLVADAYYACGKLAKRLQKKGVDLITRVRKNAVAWMPAGEYSGKGRPRKYGDKVKLWDLFSGLTCEMFSPIYGDHHKIVQYLLIDLYWKPFGEIVRFCLVDYPGKGKVILMSIDRSLDAREIIMAYGNRFKIEFSFKEMIYNLGGFCYHFWLSPMMETKSGDGDRYIHRMEDELKKKIFQKIGTYNLHVQMALIAQGLMQYLACCYNDEVWNGYGSWLRTIRPGVPASVQVVQMYLRKNIWYFYESLPKDKGWQKFVKSILDKWPPGQKNAA